VSFVTRADASRLSRFQPEAEVLASLALVHYGPDP
jgi:hypothetical protein